jgi:uncharacterized 2Fe-2S/4Fe-4S cluster protein (DUF4445 family)
MKKGIKVTFQPEGRVTYVLPGTTLIEAAGEIGIVLSSPCGGKGTCGKCRVVISRGAPDPTDLDRSHFTADELDRGTRLACQTRVQQEMVVNVPSQSRFFEQKVAKTATHVEVELEPVVRTQFFQLEEPTLEDQRADSDRLLTAIKRESGEPSGGCPVKLHLSVVRKLPSAVREKNFAVTAVRADGEVIDVVAGDTTGRCYGVAFDIGTTTVVGMLDCLDAERPTRVAARTNPQVRYGDDVVSRIEHAQNRENGLLNLQESIVGCLNDIVGELCEKAGINRHNVFEAVVGGNTTMTHLFLRIDPSYIARAPYVASLRNGMTCDAADLGLDIHPNAKVFTLPNIAGFVGGDTVAVILATGLLKSDGIRLAVDIGTNGEVVLAKDGRLVACSTAAGPAFEGARITFGMRAADGAIEKVVITDDVELAVIGNVPARGLCGSSLIDAVGELLRVGVIDMTGRMREPENLPESVPPLVRARVARADNGLRFILANPDETQIGGPIYLTQRDIRELQLAKGALAAGVATLMKEMGVRPSDLQEVLLAGAFGNFIRRSQAKRIGLLPGVPTERIKFVGNAAGTGARMALVSRACREEVEKISLVTRYVELAGRPDFHEAFAEAMLFPEP